ncbi:hypothetical protein WME90_01800 [Sorangium sp. So ce375]|uniref:hypothetical protein n=1 Tax=Sorangium sp. So ce375 TaxID=3133306 RepID=UPI003F5AF0B0
MTLPPVVVFPMDVERDGGARRIAVVQLPDGALRYLDCDACALWNGELSPAELAQAREGLEREERRQGRREETEHAG